MELKFNLVGSATWILNVDNKFNIACDPALAPKGTKYIYKGLKTYRVVEPVYNKTTFNDIKLWILTHGHFDHLDKKGLEVIENGIKVVSHKNCSKLLKKREDLNVTYLKWFEKKSVEIDGYKIEIEAVPAVHGMNLLAKILMGGVNGYLVTITKETVSKTIYVTSDAVYSDDIINALKGKKIDVMIANLGRAKSKMFGGPFTMSVEMLNKFMDKLKPTITLPIHTNDFAHFETTKEALKDIKENNKVEILQNGETVKLF